MTTLAMRLTERDARWRGWVLAILAIIVVAGLYLTRPAPVTPEEIDLVPIRRGHVLEM